jgi:hypothetical protein
MDKFDYRYEDGNGPLKNYSTRDRYRTHFLALRALQVSRNDKPLCLDLMNENDYISNTDAKTDICKAC